MSVSKIPIGTVFFFSPDIWEISDAERSLTHIWRGRKPKYASTVALDRETESKAAGSNIKAGDECKGANTKS